MQTLIKGPWGNPLITVLKAPGKKQKGTIVLDLGLETFELKACIKQPGLTQVLANKCEPGFRPRP